MAYHTFAVHRLCLAEMRRIFIRDCFADRGLNNPCTDCQLTRLQFGHTTNIIMRVAHAVVMLRLAKKCLTTRFFVIHPTAPARRQLSEQQDAFRTVLSRRSGATPSRLCTHAAACTVLPVTGHGGGYHTLREMVLSCTPPFAASQNWT